MVDYYIVSQKRTRQWLSAWRSIITRFSDFRKKKRY